jgi:hypothetical protein
VIMPYRSTGAAPRFVRAMARGSVEFFVSVVMHTRSMVSGVYLVAAGLLAQSDAIPPLNRRVVDFVRAHQGEQVGRGECWDLAAEALNTAGAKWDGNYGYGREVHHARAQVLPGDIVQFEQVEFQWEEGSAVHTVRMPHHTAVVVEVRTPGSFVIAQQNTQETGRKVGCSDLVLSRRKKGTIRFFRPLE